MPFVRSPRRRWARSCLVSRKLKGAWGQLEKPGRFSSCLTGSAIVLVWVETENVAAVFADLAQDDSEWTAWFRGQVLEITGVDLTEPAEGVPEVVLDWRA